MSLNLILIILDTFRQDHVGVYHQGQRAFDDVPACQTPNLDRFARDCLIFENAYPEALPTMPARCQLATGQRTLPFHGWQPLGPSETPIAEILQREGYVSGLISDNY